MQKLNELSLVKMAPDSLSSDEEIKRILTVIDIAKKSSEKITEDFFICKCSLYLKLNHFVYG